MKNTKKILMILVACVLLVGTAFACIATAATNVTAGDSTTIDEYLTFKRVTLDDMESGNHSSFSMVGNLDKVAANDKKHVEGMYYWNEYRPGTAGVYDDENTVSDYFYVFDYNYNPGKAHLYIEPILGVLNNIDKTPSKGFVSEFDIAFFTQLVDVPDTTKPVFEDDGVTPKTDKDGNPVYEPIMRHELQRVVEQGEVQWITYTDAYGNDVREPKLAPVWIAATDDSGKPLFYTGTEKVQEPLYDDNGQLVLDENKRVTLVDSVDDAGNPIYQVEGDPVMKIKETVLQVPGTFQGFTEEFLVQILNSGTVKDGSKDVMSFSVNAGAKTITVKMKGNLDAETEKNKYVFNADEWAHFTVQYVAETMMTYVYAGRDSDPNGRVLIGQINGLGAAENQGGNLVPVYPLRFRLGCRSSTGIVGLDNFLSYQGITVHDPDFITKIEEADEHGMLKYFVSILDNADGKQGAASRLYAFDDLGEYVIQNYYVNGNYTGAAITDATVKANVDVYLKYVQDVDGIYSSLVAIAKEENSNEFSNYVDKAADSERKLNNIQTRNEKIAIAEEFLASKGSLINRGLEVYINADTKLKALKSAINADTAANEFIHYMDLFTASVNYGANVSRIESHVKAAAEIYYSIVKDADYSSLNAADLTKLDAAIEKFVGNESEGILSAEKVIEQNTADWNSERFVGIINLIKNYGLTEDVFANDDGTISALWKMALDIVRGVDGVYDENADGFGAAYADFEIIHAYFWNALQSDHIVAIESKLNTFNNADMSYVAKAGICKFVDKYVAANESYIDFENETIVALIARNAIYQEQLKTLETDYENLLTQNIIKFVNIISYMQEMDEYLEIKTSFAEATEYYYGMDLVYDMDGDGNNDVDIDAAVAAYEEFRDYITAVEEDSVIFIASTKRLSTATAKEDIYAALVACYASTEYLDATYEGAEEAIAIYEAKYAEYNSNAKIVAEQIKETTEVVCSTRGNWGFDNIVAFVRNLFN